VLNVTGIMRIGLCHRGLFLTHSVVDWSQFSEDTRVCGAV